MNYLVRKAQDKDLDKLAFFTVAEARDAENAETDPSIVRRGVESGLSNPAIAAYWVVETDQGEVVASALVVKEWSDWNANYYTPKKLGSTVLSHLQKGDRIATIVVQTQETYMTLCSGSRHINPYPPLGSQSAFH